MTLHCTVYLFSTTCCFYLYFAYAVLGIISDPDICPPIHESALTRHVAVCMHLHACVPVLILVSRLLTKACRILCMPAMDPFVRAFPHAYCPHRRPPHPRTYSNLHIALLRPLPTLSPLPAYRLRFPSLLSLLGATDGSCLMREKPKPGSPLLGSPF